jgi:hypothetical protein
MRSSDLKLVEDLLQLPREQIDEFEAVLMNEPEQLNFWTPLAITNASSPPSDNETVDHDDMELDTVYAPHADETQRRLEHAHRALGSQATIGSFVVEQIKALIPDGVSDAVRDSMIQSMIADGSTLTGMQVNELIEWALKERMITSSTCWRSYPAGSVQRGALGYNPCKPTEVWSVPYSLYGMHDNGTPTCIQSKCPSGHTDTGLLCHYRGNKIYSAYYYYAWWHPMKWRGCAKDYKHIAGVCYYNKVPAGMSGSAWDPMKYTKTRAPISHETCAKDTMACAEPDAAALAAVGTCIGGSALHCAIGGSAHVAQAFMCAPNRVACITAFVDMVISPAAMVANLVTFGAASKLAVAVRLAGNAGTITARLSKAANALAKFRRIMKNVQTAQNAMSAAEKATEVMEGAQEVKGAFDDISSAVDEDDALALIANNYVRDQARAMLGFGTPNYKTFANSLFVFTSFLIAEEIATEMADVLVGVIDPTGIVATVQAYDHGTCQQNVPISLPLDSSAGAHGAGHEGLGLCQGDCDSNNDCAPGLICRQRSGDETIGHDCTGKGIRGWDYCVKP